MHWEGGESLVEPGSNHRGCCCIDSKARRKYSSDISCYSGVYGDGNNVEQG